MLLIIFLNKFKSISNTMKVSEVITESDFLNTTDKDLELLINFLHIRQQYLGVEGKYSFNLKEKVIKNKKITYEGLIGLISKNFNLTGGVILLKGRFDKPVCLNQVFKYLGEFHRMFKVDFVSSPNKLVKHYNAKFNNYFKVNQVLLTDKIFQKQISEEDIIKQLEYKLIIRCVGGFNGREVQELRSEIFNETPSFLDEEKQYLKRVKPVLVKDEYLISNGKKKWGNIKFPYKYVDLIKKGKGLLKLSDACQWYDNFMLWYKKHNTAIRFLLKSYYSARELKDHDDLVKVENLIINSHAGQARSPLAPELIIEFQDYEVLNSIENKIFRVFDINYSNYFSKN